MIVAIQGVFIPEKGRNMGKNNDLWSFNFSWSSHCQGSLATIGATKLSWRSFKASFPKTGHCLTWVVVL